VQLHQVRYFITLSKLLNFTRAAEMCNVTQPALTKALKKLEDEFGGALIHRERQLTQLTDLGRIILPMLERTFNAAEAARLQAKEFRSKAIAPLRIGLTPSISASLLVEPLSRLSRQIPGLRIDLIEERHDKLAEAMLAGDIHVALAGQIANLPTRIDHWHLFEERYVAIVGRDHRLASWEAVPASVVRDATWIGLNSCEVIGQFMTIFFSDGGAPNVLHHGCHESHLQHMVAAGLGVLFAPEHAPCLPTVVARPIEGDPVKRWVELLAVAGRQYSPALDAFIKTIRLLDWNQTPAAFPLPLNAAEEAAGDPTHTPSFAMSGKGAPRHC
jgi:DNA-binding transcriptional LysR family regulator